MAHKMYMSTSKLPMPSQLRPYILSVLGAPNHAPTPILLAPTHTIQLIEFTYCHDRFPEQAITQKHAKYDPLISSIQDKWWKTIPLITITVGVRGAIHEQTMDKLSNLKIPKTSIKTLVKEIHQNAIKYMTYLVLNKRKLENKSYYHTSLNKIYKQINRAHLPRRHKSSCHILIHRI